MAFEFYMSVTNATGGSMTKVMAYGWHLLCRGGYHLQWYLTLYEQPYLMCHVKKQILSFVLLVGGTDSSSCQDPRDLSILLMHSSVLSNQQGDRLSVYTPNGCSYGSLVQCQTAGADVDTTRAAVFNKSWKPVLKSR